MLMSLDLSENNLHGNIYTTGYLRKLGLGLNKLSGTIPQDIGNLQYLKELDLGQNQLSEAIAAAESQLTVSSPFFLHANENPSLNLVSTPLDGSNYHTWARGVKMALLSKNKFGFVSGAIPVPSPMDPLLPVWERCNTMVLSWLARVVSPTIAQSILWTDTAADVWMDLRDRFSHGDVFRIAELQEELYSIKQGDDSVSDYFTKLKVLWDELFNFRPLPVCSCLTRCSCGAIDTFKRYQ